MLRKAVELINISRIISCKSWSRSRQWTL